MDKVLSGYLKVQRALSKDDLGAAGKAAKELKASLGAVDMKVLKGQVHMEWMKLAKSLGTIVDALASAKDIKAARVKFASLSDSLIRAIRTFGSTGSRPIFVARCPMAFGGRGADWLQDKPEIENPYFGKAMFRCGEVRERLAGGPLPK